MSLVIRTTPDSTKKYFRNYTREHTIDKLDVAFDITKTLKSDPNPAKITVFNLSKEERTLFATSPAHLTISAGYEDNVFELYRGDIVTAHTKRRGPDMVTEITCGTGSNATRFARSNFSSRRGGKNKNIVAQLADDMGLKIPTNVSEFRSFLEGDSSANGSVISGPSMGAMAGMAGHHNIDVSVQDDSIVLVHRDGTRVGRAALLSPDTGLVHAEMTSPDGPKAKSILHAKSLLRGDFRPGGLLKMLGSEHDGNYKVLSVAYKGDIAGKSWYSELEAVSI